MGGAAAGPGVLSVARDGSHRFSKVPVAAVTLLAGLGVEGDAHCGETVRHRSRVRVNPDQPNLRQVHLLQGEILDELNGKGFDLAPGALGENLLTRGVDLLSLPVDTVLEIGTAVIRLTGLRNPCDQIEAFRPGLLAEVLLRTEAGLVRRAGVMGVVDRGGIIRPGDPIGIRLPEAPHRALERV